MTQGGDRLGRRRGARVDAQIGPGAAVSLDILDEDEGVVVVLVVVGHGSPIELCAGSVERLVRQEPLAYDEYWASCPFMFTFRLSP